jgi:hypothetical protein
MIDPLVSASFAMFSNKGVYALLLGSGTSQAASVPTGWAIVQDLIKKLAVATGENPPTDAIAWYVRKFGQQPGYSQILNLLGATPEERLNILQGYFLPTEEERAQGLKQPTPAHNAIAELVAAGYIRVILTTNFDPLIETAIHGVGLAPAVLSTPDSIEGALPIQHQACTIFKLNGDYRDLRIRNTVDELAEYDPRVQALLDRILDEYGLIVCGWSGQWDIALIRALQRARSHRFSLFWAVRDPLSEDACNLASLRGATFIEIKNADSFFRSLADKVDALVQFSRPHPLSDAIVVASVKKYLADQRHYIALHDLVQEETERVYSYITRSDLFPITFETNHEELYRRIQAFEAVSGPLPRIMSIGCHYGELYHRQLWNDVMDRLAHFEQVSGNTALLRLRRYFALLLLYAGGIAAVSAKRYGTLASLFTSVTIRENSNEEPLILSVFPLAVLDRDTANNAFPGQQRFHTPVSDRLTQILRDPLREFLPRNDRYEAVFDEFEYLLGFKYMDVKDEGDWMPIGRFSWHDGDRRTLNRLVEDARAQQANWQPVQHKLFSSHSRFLELVEAFKSNVLPHLRQF